MNSSKAKTPPAQAVERLLRAYEAKKYSEAEKIALSMTKRFPEFSLGWKVLGAVLELTNRHGEAVAALQNAIRLAPNDASVFSSIGRIFFRKGYLDKAEHYTREALKLDEGFAEGHGNLGVILKRSGKLEEAAECYSRAIELDGGFAKAYFNLGNVQWALGRQKESEASLLKAVSLKPNYHEAFYNLGNIYVELGKHKAAEESFNKAISLEPNYVEAHNNLGNIQKKIGKLEDARRSYTHAIRLNPKYPIAFSNLGITLEELGEPTAAEINYETAIRLQPDLLEAHSNVLFLYASKKFDPPYYLKLAKRYSDTVKKSGVPLTKKRASTRKNCKLRVGLVSGDFKAHPVGYFLEGLLSQVQSSKLELYAFPVNNVKDQTTERLKSLCHSWIPLLDKTNKEAAALIQKLGIDVLIDLSGHTAGNRLALFALKPAPIQASWLGYFASTGLTEIDYIIGDPFVTPKEEFHHFTEKVWQLPESYLCFTVPPNAPPVSALPALSNKFITFGSFTKLSRMTKEVVYTWTEILREVPYSKLYLKDKQLGFEAGRQSVISSFTDHGISADRLLLEGSSCRAGYLECYNSVDIALSPFPYGGGTTSIEGLWMGVPVISKKGNHFLSHLGESIAHNTNLSDWIASDNEDYIAKAVSFSSNLESLSEMREGCREALVETPLFDIQRFARNFESALWSMSSAVSEPY